MTKDSVAATVEAAMTEPWDDRERTQVTLSEVMVLSVIQTIRDRAFGDLDVVSDEQRREIVAHGADCLDYIMDLAVRRGAEMVDEPKEKGLIVIPQTHIQQPR